MSTALPTSSELVSQLRENDLEPTGRRATLNDWNAQMVSGAWPAELLGDTAFLLLTTLTEEDGSLDMVAAELMQQHGQARHLDPLKAARKSLRPRVTLRDWRLEVDRAISMIEARAANECECVAQAKHGAAAGNSGFEVLSKTSDDDEFTIRYDLRCRRCGRLWLVRERHGYHYPQSDWSERSR